MTADAHGWIQTCSLCHRDVDSGQDRCPQCLESGDAKQEGGMDD